MDTKLSDINANGTADKIEKLTPEHIDIVDASSTRGGTMRTEIDEFLVDESASVRDAIARINDNSNGIVLVVDEDQNLLGTATDGDIRRAILNDTPLSTPVSEVMCSDPTVVEPNAAESDILEWFKRDELRHIPVVDDEGTLLGLHALSDWFHQLESEESLEFPAVIMAGGLGTRLRPHTEDTPKPLVEVAGKPILERIVEHLESAGAEELMITTRYLADQIESYFGNGDTRDCDIDYLREDERLGTCGGLRSLRGQIDQSFLLMNGDLLTEFDVEGMFRFHRQQNATLTMGVRHYAMKVPYGVARVEQGQVQSLSEKPVYDFFVNAGIYILNPRALELIPEQGKFDTTQLIEILLEQDEKVSSYPILEQWMDIGRPEDLEEAKKLLSEQS